MRNLKKFLALVLTMIMIVGATGMVSADFADVTADSNYAAAINDLAVKGVIKGVTETTFGPEQDVKRWQMALFIARATTGEVESDDIWMNGIVPFVDVVNYKGAIQHSYLNGIINGMTADTFEPEAGITYIQALKMAVCALGYGTDSEDNALSWPWGYYNEAVKLGLTDNMDSVSDFDKALTREETAQIIYNMLYAAPAEDDLCYAAKYFDIPLEDNTDMFVVSATPKQWHGLNEGFGDTITGQTGPGTGYGYITSGDNKDDANFVGVQKLVGGVPTGEIYYLSTKALGIAASENIEDYFFRSVKLVNFNEETGEFGNAIFGELPVSVSSDDIEVSGSKLTVGDITYHTTDGTTNSALINELVLFDGMNIDESKTLLLTTDKDGNYTQYLPNSDTTDAKIFVLDPITEEVVACRVNRGTSGVYYYEFATGKVLSSTMALAKYGISISHGVLKASELSNKAYNLSMYDDNGDGLYDRAIYSPVFMGMYYTYKVNTTDWDGLIRDVYNTLGIDSIHYAGAVAEHVTYTDEAAKQPGAVSVFSYNPQLNLVTVYDVLELKTGTVNKITSTQGKLDEFPTLSTAVEVEVQVGRKSYQLYYFNDRSADDNIGFWTDGQANTYSILPSVLGAYVIQKPVTYSVETQDFAKVRAFNHYGEYDSMAAFVNRTFVGQQVAYYEYNGYIINADVIELSVLDKFALVDAPRSFGDDAVYFDIYTGGKYESKAPITLLDGINISKFIGYNFDYVDFLTIKGYNAPGAIYYSPSGVHAFGTIQLEVLLDQYTEYLAAGLKDARATVDGVTVSPDGTLTFDANAGLTPFDPGYQKTATLRFRAGTSTVGIDTDKNTVWYFIDEEKNVNNDPLFTPNPLATTITPFTGAATSNKYIKFDENTEIWVDDTGYASLIFVKNAVEHNFIRTNYGKETIVMVSWGGDYDNDIYTGKELGLPATYTGVYYKFRPVNDSIINLEDGTILKEIYSTFPIHGPRLYTIDEYGVVKGSYTDLGLLDHPGVAYSEKTSYAYSLYNIQNVYDDEASSDVGNINYKDWQLYATGVVSNKYDYISGTTNRAGDAAQNYREVPTDIFEMVKTREILKAGFENGKLVVTFNNAFGLVADETYNITPAHNVTQVVVYENGTKDPFYGEDAIRLLNGTTRVFFPKDMNYLNDGIAVFYVEYRGNN